MTIDDQIMDEKLQHNINKEVAKNICIIIRKTSYYHLINNK